MRITCLILAFLTCSLSGRTQTEATAALTLATYAYSTNDRLDNIRPLALHRQDAAALESVKGGWTEARDTDRYIRVKRRFYRSLYELAGEEKGLARVLARFGM